MSEKKRGGQRKAKFDIRTPREEHEAELAQYSEDDPMREMLGDGLGADFHLPIPPWDQYWLDEKAEHLSLLRVDPTSTNGVAQLWKCVVRAIAGQEFSGYVIQDFFSKLISVHRSHVAEKHFAEIIEMMKWMDRPPHRNYHAYQAYCDFLEEFGFEPTKTKLIRFIRENPEKYPVGISKPCGNKEWYSMIEDAGLFRLGK